MSKDQKKKIIEDIRVIHPRFNRAYKLIEECHENSINSSEPQCMLITAPSGTGKSTLFNTYIEDRDNTIFEERSTKKVILWDEVPSPTRIPIVIESLLTQLGDPLPTKGTIGNKNLRLINFIRDCGIQLIMLDEFQHFVHPDNKKINHDVADWFKSLVNKTKVPVVLFGLEVSKEVLKANEQLSGRFQIQYHLHPFSLYTNKDEDEFRQLVHIISQSLPFEKQTSFGEKHLTHQLFYASGGLMRPLMNLIRRAAKYAVDRDKKNMDAMDLAEAFELFGKFGKEINPFIDDEFEIA
jgi:energy-coupling factor transporter ATP-binding protein EcfA2